MGPGVKAPARWLGMDATCLVTGANGFIGSHLVDALLARGHRVVCLVRLTSNLRWLQDKPVTFARGDVTEPESLPEAVREVDYVFHVAGLTKAPAPAHFDQVNRQGTVNLLEACRTSASHLRRFILVSSLAAAGPSPDGRALTEDDPCRPVSLYGQSKLQAERAAARYQDALPLTIVRPPVVYGPRDELTLDLFRVVCRHIQPRPGAPQRISAIYVRDLVDGILLAAERPEATGRTYFMGHHAPSSIAEFTGLAARALGVWTVPLPVPVWALLTYALGSDLFAQLRRRVSILGAAKRIEMKQRYWLCDSSRADRELGFRAETPHDEGIRATALWYRQQGWLPLGPREKERVEAATK